MPRCPPPAAPVGMRTSAKPADREKTVVTRRSARGAVRQVRGNGLPYVGVHRSLAGDQGAQGDVSRAEMTKVPAVTLRFSTEPSGPGVTASDVVGPPRGSM